MTKRPWLKLLGAAGLIGGAALGFLESSLNPFLRDHGIGFECVRDKAGQRLQLTHDQGSLKCLLRITLQPHSLLERARIGRHIPLQVEQDHEAKNRWIISAPDPREPTLFDWPAGIVLTLEGTGLELVDWSAAMTDRQNDSLERETRRKYVSWTACGLFALGLLAIVTPLGSTEPPATPRPLTAESIVIDLISTLEHADGARTPRLREVLLKVIVAGGPARSFGAKDLALFVHGKGKLVTLLDGLIKRLEGLRDRIDRT